MEREVKLVLEICTFSRFYTVKIGVSNAIRHLSTRCFGYHVPFCISSFRCICFWYVFFRNFGLWCYICLALLNVLSVMPALRCFACLVCFVILYVLLKFVLSCLSCYSLNCLVCPIKPLAVWPVLSKSHLSWLPCWSRLSCLSLSALFVFSESFNSSLSSCLFWRSHLSWLSCLLCLVCCTVCLACFASLACIACLIVMPY